VLKRAWAIAQRKLDHSGFDTDSEGGVLARSAAEVGVVVQEGEEFAAVVVAEEDRLAIVAVLGQVEGVSWGCESGFAGHLPISGFCGGFLS